MVRLEDARMRGACCTPLLFFFKDGKRCLGRERMSARPVLFRGSERNETCSRLIRASCVRYRLLQSIDRLTRRASRNVAADPQLHAGLLPHSSRDEQHHADRLSRFNGCMGISGTLQRVSLPNDGHQPPARTASGERADSGGRFHAAIWSR